MNTVRGYAGLFNRIIRTQEVAAFVIQRSAFESLGGRSIGLCRDHIDSHRFAATNNSTLRLWQDQWGLAFEAEISDEQLIDEIRRGSRAQCSCAYEPFGEGIEGLFNHEPVLFFGRCGVSEISILPVGGCPDTACWMADGRPEHLTDHQQFSARMWRMGQFQNSRRRECSGKAPREGAARQAFPQKSEQQRLPTPRSNLPASLVSLMASADFQAVGRMVKKCTRLMDKTNFRK